MTGSAVVHPETAGDPPFRYGPWSWSEPRDGEHFRRCSFCGSVSPDDLAAEPAWRAEWADRKYGWPHKFYVDVPNRNPDALFAIGSTWGANAKPSLGEVPWDELTEEQHAIYGERPSLDGRHPVSVLFGPRPSHHGKFYAFHLSDPDLDPAVKADIERRSGIAFTFNDGRVAWRTASTNS
jgi:hypothetical protein